MAKLPHFSGQNVHTLNSSLLSLMRIPRLFRAGMNGSSLFGAGDTLGHPKPSTRQLLS
jgi:hypothetical protein